MSGYTIQGKCPLLSLYAEWGYLVNRGWLQTAMRGADTQVLRNVCRNICKRSHLTHCTLELGELIAILSATYMAYISSI